MSAVIAVLARMNRIIRTFRNADATEPGRSIIPTEHGIRQSFIFQRLVQRGILVQVNSERYYLDEAAEAVSRRQRRMVVLLLAALMLIGLVVAAVFAK